MYRELLPLPTADGLFLLSDIDYGHPALGVARWLQKRYDEAEALYLKTLKLQRRVPGDEHPDTLESVDSLIELYKTCGKPELAEQ